MKRDKMKQKIVAYINAAYQWHQTGNGSLTEEPGLTMSDLEAEILYGFGLPRMAFQYAEILQLEGFSIDDVEERSAELLEVLLKEATQFLLAPIEKDVDVLKQAKQNLRDAVEVLPLIGISTSVYNLYLYYDCYLKNNINENELLAFFKKSELLDCQAKTRIPFTYFSLVNGSHLKRLINQGLPFIRAYKGFLKYSSTSHKWDGDFADSDLDNSTAFKNTIVLEHFFISYIGVREDTVVIEILVEYKHSFIKLLIWCNISIMRLLMLHSRYYSLAIPPLHITKPEYLENTERHIRLKECIGHNIEIENITIGLRRIKSSDNKKGDLPDYTIDYLESKKNIEGHFNCWSDESLPF